MVSAATREDKHRSNPVGSFVISALYEDQPDGMQRMNMTGDPQFPVQSHRVFIQECGISTWIGVYEHERERPTRLLFDIEIDVDARRAAATDRIADTVDYATVVAELRAYLADQRHKLLETLSEVVADRILTRFPASRVRVRVAKVGIIEGVGRVGVEIERYARLGVSGSRTKRPTRSAGAVGSVINETAVAQSA
jgi:dihydroneopterin aldolase